MSTVLIEDDDGRPDGGYARVVLVGRGRAVAAGDIRIFFQRFQGSDPCLGRRGWQAAEFGFQPREVDTVGDDLVLIVGPEVVNQIEEDSAIRVRVPSFGVVGDLRWPATLRPTGGLPPLDDGETDDGVFSDPVKPPPPQPAPEPTPEPLPVVETVPPPPPVAATEPSPEPEAPPEEKRWPSPLMWVLTVLLSGGLLAAAILILAGEQVVATDARTIQLPEREEPPAVPEDGQEDPPDETPGPAPESEESAEPDGPEAADADTADDATEDDAAAGLGAVHQAALDALDNENFDMARSLLRQAARAGHVPSMLLFAQLLDRIDFEPGVAPAPEDGEALELYREACAASPDFREQALGDITALSAALQADADRGDDLARLALDNDIPAALAACSGE